MVYLETKQSRLSSNLPCYPDFCPVGGLSFHITSYPGISTNISFEPAFTYRNYLSILISSYLSKFIYFRFQAGCVYEIISQRSIKNNIWHTYKCHPKWSYTKNGCRWVKWAKWGSFLFAGVSASTHHRKCTVLLWDQKWLTPAAFRLPCVDSPQNQADVMLPSYPTRLG